MFQPRFPLQRFPGRAFAVAWLACVALAALPAQGAPRKARAGSAPAAPKAAARDGEAEARLIEVYRLIGGGHGRQALARAEALVRDHPTFGLAQLVYGDLLMAQVRPLRHPGDMPDGIATNGAQALAELREESQLRMRALRERPPAGAVPSQFLQLSPRSKHAIAVDTSRARLYLF